MTLQACHTYNVETLAIRRFVNEEKGIPYMNVETDYSQTDVGQLNTRIAAFIEMLKCGNCSEPSKISKNRYKMRSILEVSSEQLREFL